MILVTAGLYSFFFFNDTATTEIYTLSLHDALPIFRSPVVEQAPADVPAGLRVQLGDVIGRSEEHTSELQSQSNLVCRLLLEKKKTVGDSGRSNECGRVLPGSTVRHVPLRREPHPRQ